MDPNNTQLPFYVHYLNPQIKGYVTKQLRRSGIVLPPTYPKDFYSNIAIRLERVFSRVSQYPPAFVNTWSVTHTPGFIVYAADGENVPIRHSIKKKAVGLPFATTTISDGKCLIYYGNNYFRGLEGYVTEKRRQEMSKDSDFITMPIFKESEIKVGLISPFSPNIKVIKIGNYGVLPLAPNYVRALDSLLKGEAIFNSDGTIDSMLLNQASNTRIIVPFKYSTHVQIDSIRMVQDNDVLCIPPKILCSQKHEKFYDELVGYFTRGGRPILGETGLTNIHLKMKNVTYALTTFLRIPKPIIFDPEVGLNRELLPLLFLSSYGYTINLTSDEMISALGIIPVSPVTKTVSESLFSCALQLRKTFLMGCEMGYIVIGPKGGMKSHIKRILNVVRPELIIIDSDVYGRWVTNTKLKIKMPLQNINFDESEVPSFFEKLAEDMISRMGSGFDTLKRYGEIFARIIADKECGVAAYQNAIFESYGTTQVILFMHSTSEANIMSGMWQQVLIRPVNNTRIAVQERIRDGLDSNLFLHSLYLQSTPSYNRTTIAWVDFLLLIAPEAIDYLNDQFSVYNNSPVNR